MKKLVGTSEKVAGPDRLMQDNFTAIKGKIFPGLLVSDLSSIEGGR